MSIDYNSGLPIRSEKDGADERVHVKIVDKTNPDTQQMIVDTDSNAHVEIHGNDEANVDRVVATNEKGNIALDGDYDVSVNTNPSSVGLVAHDRNGASTDRTHQNKRVTAVIGENNTVNIDVALHDENGQNYDENNPLPVTFAESEGEEIHAFTETEDVIKNGTAVHSYVVPNNKTLLLYKVLCSSAVKSKFHLELGDGAASEAFASKAIVFGSTSEQNPEIDFGRVALKVVGTANSTTVRVTMTNRDQQSSDFHTTFVGVLKDTVI